MTFKLIQTTMNLVSKNAIHFSFQRKREETRIDVRRVHEINSLSSPNYILHHRRASPREFNNFCFGEIVVLHFYRIDTRQSITLHLVLWIPAKLNRDLLQRNPVFHEQNFGNEKLVCKSRKGFG